jgi:hypothetical protein
MQRVGDDIFDDGRKHYRRHVNREMNETANQESRVVE